ncbi:MULTISPECIES: hypothetical protein [unclassified Streptomyces]|uniref:hypothetical protein n=1 Tax=unclassified Streptomyces TaxID=2593676 RepID=UPI0037FF3361
MSDEWPDDDKLVALCDLCGATVAEEAQVHAVVADSSAVHPRHPERDGRRPLTACTPSHLADLQQEYRRRPFEKAELWAGQIDRVLDSHPDGIEAEYLVELTGLSLPQIEAAVAWHTQRLDHDDEPG